MNIPKISIIMASYNRAHMIGDSINSCLKQSFEDFELIIIDDCSSDNSAKVIEKFTKKDSRIKFIQNKENQKLPKALNIAFRKARGKYLTWISDDNLFDLDAIKIMAEYLDQNNDTGLVYTDYKTIDDSGKKIARIYQEDPEFLPIRYCIGPCFLYRSSVAKQVGEYNENLFLIEDYEFFLRMGLCTKMHHIPEAYYYYRVHKSALTQSRRDEISIAKRHIKEKFASKYVISNQLRPIYNLYMWFIEEKSFASYLKLIVIIAKNPVTTLSYIAKNLVRFFK